MAVGPGSTIKGIPEDVRNYINIVGNSANVKFDTLSRKKIPAEIYDNEGKTLHDIIYERIFPRMVTAFASTVNEKCSLLNDIQFLLNKQRL